MVRCPPIILLLLYIHYRNSFWEEAASDQAQYLVREAPSPGCLDTSHRCRLPTCLRNTFQHISTREVAKLSPRRCERHLERGGTTVHTARCLLWTQRLQFKASCFLLFFCLYFWCDTIILLSVVCPFVRQSHLLKTKE